MKKLLRQFLLMSLKATGIFSIWRYLHRHRIIILMMHGVMPPDDSSEWKPLREQLHPQILSQTLEQLDQIYNFISLDDAINMVTGVVPVRPYSMVLTFDDGYRNNLNHALPILKRYNAPATFYLACGNTEKNIPFWVDRLDYALQQIHAPSMKVQIGEETLIIDNSSREKLIKSFAALRRASKNIPRHDLEMRDEIDKLTLELEKEGGKSLLDIYQNDNATTLMSWDEVRLAIESGLITIGSHTVDHIRLSMVSSEMAKEQLERSKIMIEGKTGISCKHFCYPDGDWNQEVTEITKKCGYQSAATTNHGTNKAGDNQFCLRRINFPVTGSDIEILASVTGFWPTTILYER